MSKAPAGVEVGGSHPSRGRGGARVEWARYVVEWSGEDVTRLNELSQDHNLPLGTVVFGATVPPVPPGSLRWWCVPDHAGATVRRGEDHDEQLEIPNVNESGPKHWGRGCLALSSSRPPGQRR